MKNLKTLESFINEAKGWEGKDVVKWKPEHSGGYKYLQVMMGKEGYQADHFYHKEKGAYVGDYILEIPAKNSAEEKKIIKLLKKHDKGGKVLDEAVESVVTEKTSVKKGDYVLYKGNGSKWVKSEVMQVISSKRKLHIEWNDEYIEVDAKDVKPVRESVNESKNTKELTKIFNKEFEVFPFDYKEEGSRIIIDPNGYNPDGTLFSMKDDWREDIMRVVQKNKKKWHIVPNNGGGLTIHVKESVNEELVNGGDHYRVGSTITFRLKGKAITGRIEDIKHNKKDPASSELEVKHQKGYTGASKPYYTDTIKADQIIVSDRYAKWSIGESLDEGKMPDKYVGNDEIVYLKTKEDSRGANYNLYWKGHDIDAGGRRFGSEKELKDFAADYILSIQLYKKLRYEDPKPLPESVNEAKMLTLKDYLKKLDSTIIDGVKAVKGENGSDNQILPTRGDILQNFQLFRNYIGSLIKRHGDNKTKLKFLSEQKNIVDEALELGVINEELPTQEIDPNKFKNPFWKDAGFFKKGYKDGSTTDDAVNTKPVKIQANRLKPSQDAVYLGKALGMAIGGVEGGDLGAVISLDNRILDGHHRWAATIFNNPKARVGGVKAELRIGDLVPVLRQAGDALGNKRGLPPKGGDVNIFKATLQDVKDCVYDGENMNPQFYNRDKAIAWFEEKGDGAIQASLNLLQKIGPPAGAPPRADMPKIEPDQVDKVAKKLAGGALDVRHPYANS